MQYVIPGWIQEQKKMYFAMNISGTTVKIWVRSVNYCININFLILMTYDYVKNILRSATYSQMSQEKKMQRKGKKGKENM